MKKEISFSFLPLANSDFSFEIYRRAANGEKSQYEYRYNLPINGEQKDIRDDFFVSFTPRNECVKHDCNSFDNIGMTKKWLSFQLTVKAGDIFQSTEYFLGTKFVPRISFVLQRTQYGSQVIDADPYFLKATGEFGFLIDFRFASNEKGKFSIESKKLSLSLANDGQKNKNFYTDKYRKAIELVEKILPKLFPIIYVGGALDIQREFRSLPYSLLKEKTYLFGDKKEGGNQFSGLMEHHPFMQPAKEPMYIFVFHKSRVNVSRELVKALRGETYKTFIGMQKMFNVAFTNDRILSIQVDDYSKESLASIESQLVNIINQYPDSQLVGIFAGIQKDFDDSQPYSPYYIVKNTFLKNGLAVQAVTIEQTLKRDGLKWSISGIGLQLFVKLGGVPWKVVPQNDECVIFGISSAHLKNTDGTIRKYYAYSVCLDSSGLYRRLDVLSTSDSKSSYMQSLKEHVSQTLQEQITSGITKCAIHVPFKLRYDEMKCLRECANEYKKDHTDIEIVFIKINVENRFFGYSDYNSKIPLSGSYIELSEREFLVWFEGLQQGKENLVTSQSITNPVHIQFLGAEGLTKEQINAYLQDVINLSGANWRGYNAKHTPVSIYYPELIAKFIGRFDQYDLEMNLGLGAIDKAWFV